MDYFFIAGNVASVAAVLGFLLQMGHVFPDDGVMRWTLGIFAAGTALFWLYFYFAPKNKVKSAVRKQLGYAGWYVDSANQSVGIYEGEFVMSSFHPLTVEIPPFDETPVVTVLRTETSGEVSPSVSNRTRDSVEFSAITGQQYGRWKFRARGKQLKRAAE